MTNIYDQHNASFRRVSAFVVLWGANRVATIAFKYPNDGAGRLYVYAHWCGVEMVRGYAGGFGYDKQSAACASAARKLPEHLPEGYAGAGDVYGRFVDALGRDDGQDWQARLRAAGFIVLQAV